MKLAALCLMLIGLVLPGFFVSACSGSDFLNAGLAVPAKAPAEPRCAHVFVQAMTSTTPVQGVTACLSKAEQEKGYGTSDAQIAKFSAIPPVMTHSRFLGLSHAGVWLYELWGDAGAELLMVGLSGGSTGIVVYTGWGQQPHRG